MPWLHKIFLKSGACDQYLVWNRATLNLHRKRLHRKRLHRNGENDATVGEDKAIPHPINSCATRLYALQCLSDDVLYRHRYSQVSIEEKPSEPIFHRMGTRMNVRSKEKTNS